MTHKAFEVIGERILLIDTSYRNKEGIFQESNRFQTTAEGSPRPALDFIEPIYHANPTVEELAKGLNPRERVNPNNPILSLHLGIDQLKLSYRGKREESHVFKGELSYVQGVFFNDGNFEVYDKYKESLSKAGFKIE
ncbi:MAG: hypothetical protein AABX29_03305 [Nanoarchaeota archaeon]